MLQILDQRWRDHLSDMDYLRDGIHLRQVAQQDPLTAWQKEGYLMFEHLLADVDRDYVRYITHVEAAGRRETRRPTKASRRRMTNVERGRAGRHGTAGARRRRRKPAPKEGDKIGRNEPCWCGSGRKFKQCHGRP